MMFTEAGSLGASTATFGLLGAQGIFLYHNRAVYGAAVRQALNGLITVLAINLVIGLSPGIDNWGHIGGLLGGIVFAWLGGPILGINGVYPNYILADQRKRSEIIQAVVITGLFLGILASGAIYLLLQ
jgi:rhomboid protease GluP